MESNFLRIIEELVYGQYRRRTSISLSRSYDLQSGKNDDVDSNTYETVWINGGNEVYLLVNGIDTISSDSIFDFNEVSIIGHVADINGEFTLVTQTAILNGRNKVLLETPLIRIEKVTNVSPFPLSGNLYVYEDTVINNGEPNDSSKIHIIVNAEDNQSAKCALTSAKNEFIILTSCTFGVFRNGNRCVNFLIDVRPFDEASRVTYRVPVSSADGFKQIAFEQPIILPPNSDIRVRAKSTNNNTMVSAAMHVFYATITA